MKVVRIFALITLLVIIGTGVLYFYAPLGFEGTQDANVTKVNDLIYNDWNVGEAQVATYSLLSLDGINIPLFQDSTWWSFSVLVIAFMFVLGSFLAKSHWVYFGIGLMGIIVIVFASFLVGSVLFILAVYGIVSYAVRAYKKEKERDFSYLYREYI